MAERKWAMLQGCYVLTPNLGLMRQVHETGDSGSEAFGPCARWQHRDVPFRALQDSRQDLRMEWFWDFVR